jgi:regulator of protease activity HflC (stomatin/prohibitin superfamily)
MPALGTVVSSAAFLVLAIAIFAFISVGQVDQNEYGLVMNWVTKKIGNRVYHGGTHMIGFWNTFVVFPATIQTIEFSERPWMHTSPSLHTRTKEGLGLHLSISFQYKLNPTHLPKLYALTNLQYEGLFMRIARDQLLEAASEYEGPQYWQERRKIGDHMRRLVDQQLAESYASLWGLQLLVIDLPDQYEMSITMTQVQQQMAKTRANEQVAAGIRADTEVMNADYNRQIKIIQAGADANYTLETKLAKAEAAKRKIKAEADALAFTRKELKLSAAGAVEYQQLGAYASLENATFLANVLGTTPVLNAAGGGKAAAASLVQTEQDSAKASDSQSASGAPVIVAKEAKPTNSPSMTGSKMAKFLQGSGRQLGSM